MKHKEHNWEKNTVYKMIRLFCKAHHNTDKQLCNDCSHLYNYSIQRINNCSYKLNKPVCSNCKTHCYNKENREKIRLVMRWAGPKMLWHYPFTSIKYLYLKSVRGLDPATENKV